MSVSFTNFLMGSNETFSICVSGENEKEFYRIMTVWSKNDFILTLLDESKAFQSNVSHDQLCQLAEQHELPFEEYFEKIKGSLQENKPEFAYKRDDNKFFIFRRHGTVTIQFANFILEPADFTKTVNKFIDDVTNLALTFKNKLVDTEKSMDTILSTKYEQDKKLRDYVHLKEDMEEKLYDQFILILNEKKLRIQVLEEMLDAYKSGQSFDSSDEEIKTKKPTISKRLEIISSSESSSDEGEKVVDEVQVKLHEKPEKSKNKFNLFDDNSPPPIVSLPKRVKISPPTSTIDTSINSTDTSGNISVGNSTTSTSLSTSAGPSTSANTSSIFDQIEMKNSVTEEDPKEDSQESLNFCTQDLMDRL